MDATRLTPNQAVGQVKVDLTKVEEKTYYANLDGFRYYFKDGSVAEFIEGQYTTAQKGRQEELDEVVQVHHHHNISDKPMLVRHSDAVVLKEVGGGNKGGPAQSSTGTLGSTKLAGLVK